jgi:N-acetyl-gamma-glutamyl-phosphate reductase
MQVAVVGASGYTGLELLRLLLRHPRVELAAVTSERQAGRPVADVFPALRGLVDLCFESAEAAAVARRAELVFTALPHVASAPVVRDLRKADVRVLDLSADFRLRDAETYGAWYGGPHPAPELLDNAVYGLPELYRAAVREAALVAVPGCYPTSVLLPLVPFLRRGLVDPASILVDAKSGVSGAGRRVEESYLFSELDENCRAYKVGGAHRHVPEIEQQASDAAGESARVAFVPHLLPTIRGIVTTIFVQPRQPLATSEARAVLEEAYDGEPFVRLLAHGETPSLASVRGSNFCDVTAFVDARTGVLELFSALDNLVKGAGGQAVQCMNLMCGYEETDGLREAPFVP